MSTMAATFRESFLERRFRFAEHGTTLARDTMAGVTTFIVMSYIIFLNPIILTSVKQPDGRRCRSTASSPRPASSPR